MLPICTKINVVICWKFLLAATNTLAVLIGARLLPIQH